MFLNIQSDMITLTNCSRSIRSLALSVHQIPQCLFIVLLLALYCSVPHRFQDFLALRGFFCVTLARSPSLCPWRSRTVRFTISHDLLFSALGDDPREEVSWGWTSWNVMRARSTIFISAYKDAGHFMLSNLLEELEFFFSLG